MRRCRVFISGFVQGVNFRAFTKRRADEIGLSGFVRNLSDGRVEAVVEGDENKINEFIERLKEGPFGSRIEKTEMRWGNPTTEFRNFEIRL